MDLVHACVLLDLESSGGLNIFSAPRSPGCGQPRGTPVTEETWQAYLARRGECGTQGAGPMQITWAATQDVLNATGAAWLPEVNVRLGLELFAGYLARVDNARDAYSLYNTGSPGESPYATKALARLLPWQRVIDGGRVSP